MKRLTIAAILMGLGLYATGCSTDGQPNLLPNPDPQLRKTSAELAADAAKRHYPSDATSSGKADARADFDLQRHRFDLVNLSNESWPNVEVWLNDKYVVFIPDMKPNQDEKLDFEMFYDDAGHHFSTHGGKIPIQSLQVYYGGKLYDVTTEME